MHFKKHIFNNGESFTFTPMLDNTPNQTHFFVFFPLSFCLSVWLSVCLSVCLPTIHHDAICIVYYSHYSHIVLIFSLPLSLVIPHLQRYFPLGADRRQKKRQRSSLPFGGQNLFNSLPFCTRTISRYRMNSYFSTNHPGAIHSIL